MGRAFTIVAVVGAAALVFSGCDSERSLLDFNFGKSKSKTEAPASEATDIFDEFYMSDEGEGGESAETDSSAAVAVPATRFQRQQASARAASETPAKTASTAARPAGSYNFIPHGRYVVQVNSTPLRRDADRMAARLKNMGFPAYVAETENPTQELFGTYYRVRIGGFDGYSEAQAFGEGALVPAGFKYWIDRRVNDRAGVSFSAPPQGMSGSEPWPTPTSESRPSSASASQPESIIVEVAPVPESEQRGDGW